MKRLLFQGDSITDCDRFYCVEGKGLGCGYVRMIANYLEAKNAPVEVINKGISGDKTSNLLTRWKEDCLDLSPDVLTILVGINDVWEQMDSQVVITIEDFERNYEALLKQFRDRIEAELIIMEPYVLPYPEDRIRWRPILDPQIHVIRRLAKKYHARYIPLDGLLNKAAIESGYDAIAQDGAHLTPYGHSILCDAWLAEYEKLYTNSTLQEL